MKIAMIGTGYVGLVSGVCFSDFGHEVICVDKNPEKIEMLRRGDVPIFEPGLDQLMASNVEAGRLAFSDDLAAAVDGADAVFIAVGTPTLAEARIMAAWHVFTEARGFDWSRFLQKNERKARNRPSLHFNLPRC